MKHITRDWSLVPVNLYVLAKEVRLCRLMMNFLVLQNTVGYCSTLILLVQLDPWNSLCSCHGDQVGVQLLGKGLGNRVSSKYWALGEQIWYLKHML